MYLALPLILSSHSASLRKSRCLNETNPLQYFLVLFIFAVPDYRLEHECAGGELSALIKPSKVWHVGGVA